MASADWEDALERLDVTFLDFQTMGELINRLDAVLGRTASTEQIAQANELFQTEQQQLFDIGITADVFVRAGREVTILRDRFGRFVSRGASAIKERIARGAG